MSHSIAEEHFPNTRSQTVIQKLREMILSGELTSGIRLHEVPLSENLQVSRTPVRDALSVLAHEGLLDYRPNRGYVVKRFGLQEVVDAFTVRRALEVMACRLLGEKGLDGNAHAKLQALLNQAATILAKGFVTADDWSPYREADAQFHWIILTATGNDRLAELAEQVVRVPMVSSLAINWSDLREGFRRGTRGQRFHKQIMEALLARDGERAGRLMDKHFEWGLANLQRDFRSVTVDDVTLFTLRTRRRWEK